MPEEIKYISRRFLFYKFIPRGMRCDTRSQIATLSLFYLSFFNRCPRSGSWLTLCSVVSWHSFKKLPSYFRLRGVATARIYVRRTNPSKRSRISYPQCPLDAGRWDKTTALKSIHSKKGWSHWVKCVRKTWLLKPFSILGINCNVMVLQVRFRYKSGSWEMAQRMSSSRVLAVAGYCSRVTGQGWARRNQQRQEVPQQQPGGI